MLEVEPGLDLAEPDRTWFADVNRIRLRVWEWGDENAPPVICVHGAYDHGRMWDDFAPRLAKLGGFRVVCPDLRGHGDSSRLGTGHIWLSSALDLGLLARQLGPPVGFVGHSFGGGQALFVAAAWPELVRWVVNLDGLGPSPDQFAERDMVEAATMSVTALTRRVGAPARTYPSLEDMAERRGNVNVRLPKPWVDHLVRHGATETDGSWTWKSDPTFGVGLPGEFDLEYLHAEQELVTVPVLALTGEEHDTWSDMTAEQVAERVTHIRTAVHRVIKGAGHYVHIERPEAVLDAIAEFLDL